MPSGVGVRARAVRVVTAVAVGLAALAVLAPPTQAQEAPGITIQKVAIGGDVTATFEVSGPGIDGVASLSASAVGDGPPAVAGPPIAFPLTIGSTYTITEIEPLEGISPFELTSIECTDGTEVTGGNRTVQVTLTQENPNITCTFTNTLTRASILGLKIAIGDTSSWVRPAQFHITCSGPNFELDIDIEPPVGPGGPGTYVIGQGSLPPGTCTISETDTGSNFPPTVSMVVTNHGSLIAFGGSSVTFTSHAGDDLVLRVTNTFQAGGPPVEDPGTTTTIAGGTTTTTATTTSTATTATTIPGGGTTTVPGGGGTTVPGGGTGAAQAPATTTPQLPVTGSLAGGLIVFALVAMTAGVVLVARTRRLVD